MKTSPKTFPEAHDLCGALKDLMIVSELPVVRGRFVIEEHFLLDRLADRLDLPDEFKSCAIYFSTLDKRQQTFINHEEKSLLIIPFQALRTSDNMILEPFVLYEVTEKEFAVKIVSDGWVAGKEIPEILRRNA